MHSMSTQLAPGSCLTSSAPDFKDQTSVDVSLEQAYDAFFRVFKDIIGLRRHRNLLQPAVSLPPEILIEIFHYCPQLREKVYEDYYGFSQVCHRWRMVAIGTPSLWTTPDFHRPHLAKAMYQDRASNLPLTVYSPRDFRRPPRSTDQRTRAIHILTPTIKIKERLEEEDGICSYLSGKFPVLETLHLQCLNEGASPKPLPLDLEAPSLRKLVLQDWHPQWRSQWLEGLTSLSVSIQSQPHSASHHDPFAFRNIGEPVNISDFLDRAKKLQSLTLRNVMSFGKLRRPRHGAEPSTLPNLQDLHICDNIDMVCPLLSLLRMPSSKAINHQVVVPGEYFGVERLSTSIRDLLAMNDWTDFDDMSLCMNKFMTTTLVQRHTADTTGTIMRTFKVNFIGKLQNQDAYLWTEAICDLPIQNLSSVLVNLEAHSVDEISDLWFKLGQLPALSRVEVCVPTRIIRPIEDFIEALEPDEPGEPQSFPALQTLHLSHIAMESELPDLNRLHGVEETAYSRLAYILKIRKDAGVPPVDVLLDKCSFGMTLEELNASKPPNVRCVEPRFTERVSIVWRGFLHDSDVEQTTSDRE